MNFYKYLYTGIVLTLLVSLSSCIKYEPVGEGAWNDGMINTKAPSIIRQLAYADANNAIWITDYQGLHKRKIATASAFVTNISISPTLDKIAYKTTSNGNIQIVDSVGNAVATIPNSGSVYYFEWYSPTLLYGVNRAYTTRMPIKLYGTSDLPTDLPRPIIPSPTINYLTACYITPEKDLLYTYSDGTRGKIAYMKYGTNANEIDYPIFSEIHKLHQGYNKAILAASSDIYMYSMDVTNRTLSFDGSNSRTVYFPVYDRLYKREIDLIIDDHGIINSYHNDETIPLLNLDSYPFRQLPVFDTK